MKRSRFFFSKREIVLSIQKFGDVRDSQTLG
jgi:hypothetical protein